MRLIDAPVGIFRFHDELVLKTEYMTAIDDVYVPECYIVSTGEKFWGGMKSKDDFKKLFNDLEVEIVDIDPAPHWIPVTERLPEEPFGCLVTVMDTNPMTMDEFPNILPYFVGYDGESWNDSDGDECPFEILAWMPLPEPWEGEQDEVMGIDRCY